MPGAKSSGAPTASFDRFTVASKRPGVPSTAARLAWTNEESNDGALTTVTFDEKEGRTRLTLHERYPSKAALDHAIQGMEGCMAESFDQLEALLATLGDSGLPGAAAGSRA